MLLQTGELLIVSSVLPNSASARQFFSWPEARSGSLAAGLCLRSVLSPTRDTNYLLKISKTKRTYMQDRDVEKGLDVERQTPRCMRGITPRQCDLRVVPCGIDCLDDHDTNEIPVQ